MLHTRRLPVIAVLALIATCGTEPQRDTRELTRRQKDSIVARMPVPGAKGVGRALDVAGTAEARAAAMDSIR